MDSRLKLSGMTAGLLQPLCHAPTPPHPGPLPQGEREEAQAGKPVRGLSSQEKKGRSPPPAPPVFPPPTGAEKTEESQGGHRGLSCPPVPLVFPPVLAGIHRQRGAGGAEAARKRSEAVGSGACLAPFPLAGAGQGEGRKWPVGQGRVPRMCGNDVGSGEWGVGRTGGSSTYAGNASFLAA